MGLRLRSWLIGGTALLTTSTLLAHHSVAYYSTDTIELNGEITAIQWQNPHISFALRTVDGGGAQKTWRLDLPTREGRRDARPVPRRRPRSSVRADVVARRFATARYEHATARRARSAALAEYRAAFRERGQVDRGETATRRRGRGESRDLQSLAAEPGFARVAALHGDRNRRPEVVRHAGRRRALRAGRSTANHDHALSVRIRRPRQRDPRARRALRHR